MGHATQVEFGSAALGRIERRRYPRFKCVIPVEIRLPGVSFPSQGQTTDISLGGCYISSGFNMSVGTEIELKLWVGDVGVKTTAIIRTSDPGVGNGMEFTGLDEAGKQTLSAFLDKLDPNAVPPAEPDIKDLLIN
jgi:c-di-GMP-binding flagellar brake protein YcgR